MLHEILLWIFIVGWIILFLSFLIPEKHDPDYYTPGLNEVIAWDGGNCLLVKARSSWNITGDLRYEYRYHVFNQGKGIYLVSFGSAFRDGEPAHGEWYKATGVVTPRKKGDLVKEIMEGYEHIYASVRALEPIPQAILVEIPEYIDYELAW